MAVSSLLQRLAPYVEKEINPIINPKGEAETLASKLEKLRDGLQDAERKGATDLNVRRWLKELEDVMYKIEDALDKWEMKDLQLEIELSEDGDASHPCEKVRSLFKSPCLRFKHVVGRHKIAREMKALSERLDGILEAQGRYSFVPDKNDKPQDFKQEESTSFVDESDIHGRDSDKDSLVKMLLSKDKEISTQVISIVGIGGVGKTTLAQVAYNDPRVTDHFDLKAWVSVPNPFNASEIAKAILENVRPQSGHVENSSSGVSTLEALGQRIKDVVSRKKFILVLDNVWTEDPNKWESLKSCLSGALECRILLTTRSEIVARTMGTSHSHLLHLKLLSDKDCAKILNKIALDGRSEDESERFREIGSEIAKKCNGLPLAARSIGSMLSLRFTVEEWRDVLESPLLKYEDEISDTFRLLKLSYFDLPQILKHCLLTCALYPGGSTFCADELTRIWTAQGFINSSATGDEGDEIQSKGIDYFRTLSMRSFFQDLERSQYVKRGVICKMHDVMHDFVNSLSRNGYYFVQDGRIDQRPHCMPSDSMAKIRYFSARFVSQQDLPPDLFILLKSVRVLCLNDCDLEVLPQEVGELIHMRYLDLSGNPIKELPETVCYLCNLQTLDLRRCPNLLRLPHGIRKLIKLRYLLISDLYKLREYTVGLEKLAGLWKLDTYEFIAERDSVGCLRNLNQLRGFLRIHVKGLNEAGEAEKANLRNKVHIQELELILQDVSMDAIEAMVPPPQLQSLYIYWWYGTKQVPSWITTTYLNNLKNLTIKRFGESSFNLAALGKLPMLETLVLEFMRSKRVTLEFLGVIPEGTSNAMGGFPKLKVLVFSYCKEWEEWEDLEEATAVESLPIMPCLHKLEISFCPKLKALPESLLLHVATTLQNLTIIYSSGLESRYHKEIGADRNKISHIPRIDTEGSKTAKIDAAYYSWATAVIFVNYHNDIFSVAESHHAYNILTKCFMYFLLSALL